MSGGEARGRYSIVGIRPDIIWRCRDGRAQINVRASEEPDSFVPDPGEALTALRRLIRGTRMNLPRDLPPMAVGLFGYLGYDMARLMEPMPPAKANLLGIPDALFLRPTITAIFDSLKDEISVVSPVFPAPGTSAQAAYAAAAERIDAALADLERPVAQHDDAAHGKAVAAPASNVSHDGFVKNIARAKEAIASGVVSQLMLSQRFEIRFETPPSALYRALRRLVPSPFLYFMDFGKFSIAGSSPEILVRVRDGKMILCPLGGSGPPGASPADKAQRADKFASDTAQRAAHERIVDVARADATRLCKPGTVRVTEDYRVRSFPHGMHFVSQVEGQLDDRNDALDAFSAAFPVSIQTGVPKRMAMQIIDELEAERRGVFAGGIGYFAADGSLDTCMTVRTAVMKDGMMHVQVGSYIGPETEPEYAYQEAVTKAKVMLRAVEEAVRFASLPHRG